MATLASHVYTSALFVLIIAVCLMSIGGLSWLVGYLKIFLYVSKNHREDLQRLGINAKAMLRYLPIAVIWFGVWIWSFRLASSVAWLPFIVLSVVVALISIPAGVGYYNYLSEFWWKNSVDFGDWGLRIMRDDLMRGRDKFIKAILYITVLSGAMMLIAGLLH